MGSAPRGARREGDLELDLRTRAFDRALGFRDTARLVQDNPEWRERLTLCLAIP